MSGKIINIPKGTKDVLPAQSHKWQYLERVLRGTAKDFGFSEIRFPIFEHTDLFLRGVGTTTDIVQKEMYTFEDKGGRSITLRPEGTASVVRSVIENGLYAQTMPLKVYYIGPVFRYEKPQAGRLRQHHQFGVELFGSESPVADAEVICLANEFLSRLGIGSLRVSINSIGCAECRPAYHTALREYYQGHIANLCTLCQNRFENNPLRLLDCKEERCSAVAKNAPHTTDYLCEDCFTHFEALKEELELLGIEYIIDTRIVRGLDYYTRTVFEFVSSDIGAQGTVCGGGRYDGLVENLGGPKLPALGFGSGIERLMLTMEATGAFFPESPVADIFFAYVGDAARRHAHGLTCALRKRGISAMIDTVGRSLKAQMKYAGRSGARYSVIIGSEEIESRILRLKNMASGEEKTIDMDADAIFKAVEILQREEANQ